MRTRFLISTAMTDLLSLAGAMVLASMIVFETPLPWNAPTPGSVFPMLGFMGISMLVTSALTEQMSGPGVPRPSYGRMVVIWAGMLLFTAGLFFIFRDAYWSRSFVPISATI
jgi:hypothetical protein